MVEDDPRSGGSSTSTDLTMAAIIDKDGRLTLEEIAQKVKLSFFFHVKSHVHKFVNYKRCWKWVS